MTRRLPRRSPGNDNSQAGVGESSPSVGLQLPSTLYQCLRDGSEILEFPAQHTAGRYNGGPVRPVAAESARASPWIRAAQGAVHLQKLLQRPRKGLVQVARSQLDQS